MNFKLIHDYLLRGQGRPKHLIPLLRTDDVGPIMDESIENRNDDWPSPPSPSHVPSNPRVRYDNNPIIYRYDQGSREYKFDEHLSADEEYHSTIAMELDIDEATLIPVHKYIKKNVTTRKGKHRKKLVRDTNTWANHLRDENAFRAEVDAEMVQYQEAIDQRTREFGEVSGNNYRNSLRQRVIAQYSDRILAMFERSHIEDDGTIVRQEIIVVGRFQKKRTNNGANRNNEDVILY